MSRKPSQRSNIENNDPKELNMVPYLDIVTNIIMFMLFTTTAAGAIGVINVASPKLGGAPPGAGAKDEKPPLNLSVFVTDKGFTVAATGGVLPGAAPAGGEADKKAGPTIPRNTSDAVCRDMKKNENAPCYDYAALTKKMAEVKKIFPEETKLNLAADSEIPFHVIVNTMDATRENAVERDDMGKAKPLFFDVILAAGL